MTPLYLTYLSNRGGGTIKDDVSSSSSSDDLALLYDLSFPLTHKYMTIGILSAPRTGSTTAYNLVRLLVELVDPSVFTGR